MDAITLNIPQEMLQKAFDNHIEKLLGDTYNNPVKSVIDELLGYSSKHPLKEEIKLKIATTIDEMIKSEKFITLVGEAFAKEIAKRQADAMASSLNKR